ncbi:MAG: PKD domain protein [Methanoregula sp. PtaU1.Bin051]|nr:MAG: PKD domain protein [Methanoregula sp. PtaU1.Bin051]
MRKEFKILLSIGVVVLLCCAVLIISTEEHVNPFKLNKKPISVSNDQTTIRTMIPVKNDINRKEGSMFNIIINISVPAVPQSVVLYKGILSEENISHQIIYESPYRHSTKNSTPSITEAPIFAEAAMVQYGGLPPDAVFTSAFIHEAYSQKSNGEITARYPKSTQVAYSREINGMPLVGRSDGISLDLGENGELLYMEKIWRTLEDTGTNVSVISIQQAIEKLQNGETINQYQAANDVEINSVRLGYFERGGTNLEELYPREILLEPCWIFYGVQPQSQSKVKLYVYARRFVNFTATPTTGKVPLTITFTDASDASPVKWNWDFGDGTNSTERNPVHAYTNAGNYTVSLRGWNDLGSDTMEKTNFITISPKTPPIANFTADPASGTVPLNVTFTDMSTNAPVNWTWDFGDGTNAMIQNPVHLYTSLGNYTVSLNVTNEDGADSMIKTDYITVSNPPPTTIPTTTATTTVTTATTVTTKPTTKPTRQPLSPLVAICGFGIASLVFVLIKKR